jgi:hypothetical protein
MSLDRLPTDQEIHEFYSGECEAGVSFDFLRRFAEWWGRRTLTDQHADADLSLALEAAIRGRTLTRRQADRVIEMVNLCVDPAERQERKRMSDPHQTQGPVLHPLVMYVMRHFDDVEHDPQALRNRAEAALADFIEHLRRNAPVTFPEVSREAWAAAMVIDDVIERFFKDCGISRKEGAFNVKEGAFNVIVTIAKLMQTTLDRAAVNWELGKLKESHGQEPERAS